MSVETESNGTFSTADAISSGVEIKGQLHSSTEWDVFEIAATAAGSLTLSFDAPTDNSWSDYFEVNLYDSEYNIIGGQKSGKDISFTAGIEAGGTYYAGVTSDSYWHDNGEYGLTVTTSVQLEVLRQSPMAHLALQML